MHIMLNILKNYKLFVVLHDNNYYYEIYLIYYYCCYLKYTYFFITFFVVKFNTNQNFQVSRLVTW